MIEIPEANPYKSVLKVQNCLGAMHEVVLGARGSILKIIPASAWSPLKMQRQQDIFCIKFSYHQAVSTALSHTHTHSAKMMKFLKCVTLSLPLLIFFEGHRPSIVLWFIDRMPCILILTFSSAMLYVGVYRLSCMCT